MSYWTHVAGIVRIDTFGRMDAVKKDEEIFDEFFGKVLNWGDDETVWAESEEHPELFMPLGYEGSLKRSVWCCPDASWVPRYAISVFGDLRGYTDVDRIIEWFKGVCNKIADSDYCAFVRNACIVATCDLQRCASWYYDPCEDMADTCGGEETESDANV